MKVKTLINKLMKMNPEAEAILINDYSYIEGEYKVDVVEEWDDGRVRVDTTHTYRWDDEDNKWHK